MSDNILKDNIKALEDETGRLSRLLRESENRAKRLQDERDEAVSWVRFCVGEVGTYKTPMIDPAREYLKKLNICPRINDPERV